MLITMVKKLSLVLLIGQLLCLNISKAQNHEKVERKIVGVFLNQIVEHIETNNPWIIKPDGEPLFLEEISFNDFENKTTISGKIQGVKNSKVLFKIKNRELYGYAVDNEKDIAFEYKSGKKGVVIVEQIDPHEVLHIDHMKRPSEMRKLERRSPIHVVSSTYPHLSDYQPGMDLTRLESKPGSQYVIFLDMRKVFNGNTPKHLSSKEMYEVWQGTATGYCPFDVNVTTSVDVYNAASVNNSCIADFLDVDGRSYAYLNSFGSNTPSVIYKDPSGRGYALTVVHEVGHQYGLKHDGGQPGGEYYEGIAEYDWNSYMGNFWFTDFNQWSKGEYTGANNQQDDLADISEETPFRTDDNGGSKALVFDQGQSTLSIDNNIGLIERNTDEDVFTFDISSIGLASFKIETIEYLTMLDIDARIEDPNGNVIASSNVQKDRYAEFKDVALSLPGTYKLIIKGGAEGTPNWGFSNYGSLGVYGISGEVTGSISNGGLTVSIVQFNPFPSVCEELEPSIEVLNAGDKSINSVELMYSIDGGQGILVQKTGLNLISGSSANLTLPTISQKGIGIEYTVTITKVNGASVSSSPLTTRALTYSLGTGIEMELSIPESVADQFNWNIKDDNNTMVSDPNSVGQTIKENGNQKMRFCLADDCFKMELPAPDDLCSSYEQWNASKNYGVQGTKVYHTSKDASGNYILYSNKWWAGSTNVPGSGDPWEEIGTCSNSTVSSGEFILKRRGESGYLINSSFGGANDELQFEFCSSDITSTKGTAISGLKFGPNPFINSLFVTVANQEIIGYKIYSINGQLIKSEFTNSNEVLEIGQGIKRGVYFLTIHTEGEEYPVKIIKK